MSWRPFAAALVLTVGVALAGCGEPESFDTASDSEPIGTYAAEPDEPTTEEDAAAIRSLLRKMGVWKTFGMAPTKKSAIADGETIWVDTNRIKGTSKGDGALFLVCDVIRSSKPEILQRNQVLVAGFKAEGGATSLGSCDPQ